MQGTHPRQSIPVNMVSAGKISVLLLLLCTLIVLGKRKSPSRNRPKQKQKPKQKPDVKTFNVSSLEEGPGSCPGKYLFEDGDSLELTSPGYPSRRYPNQYNCQWNLEASGCQFNVICDDLFTRPVCSGRQALPS